MFAPHMLIALLVEASTHAKRNRVEIFIGS